MFDNPDGSLFTNAGERAGRFIGIFVDSFGIVVGNGAVYGDHRRLAGVDACGGHVPDFSMASSSSHAPLASTLR